MDPNGSSSRSGTRCRRRSPAVRVVLGAHRLEEPEQSQQVFSVVESIAHPHYKPTSPDNDIRLLKVSPAPPAAAELPAGRGGAPRPVGCGRDAGRSAGCGGSCPRGPSRH